MDRALDGLAKTVRPLLRQTLAQPATGSSQHQAPNFSEAPKSNFQNHCPLQIAWNLVLLCRGTWSLIAGAYLELGTSKDAYRCFPIISLAATAVIIPNGRFTSTR